MNRTARLLRASASGVESGAIDRGGAGAYNARRRGQGGLGGACSRAGWLRGQ